MRSISSAAIWVAERSGSAGARLHGAFEHAEHELAEQRLVADAQGVEIIFHLGVGGVPFFQRAAGQPAGDVGQRARAGHGGLHW